MTAPIIERDVDIFERIESLLTNPKDICKMGSARMNSTIAFCLGRLNRLQMGGRSSALEGMTVFLWHVHECDAELELDVEKWLALSFRVAGDPSFVQPEWGIALAGVLLARYLDRLPEKPMKEVSGQCKLLLEHFQECNEAPLPVQRSAQALIESWNAGFPNGLTSVLEACLRNWPSSAEVGGTSSQELEQHLERMAKDLPTKMTLKDRRLYRLFLERRGKWEILENIHLG